MVFKGDEQRYGEWEGQAVRVSSEFPRRRPMEWILWAGSQASTIDEDLIEQYQGVKPGGDQVWESAVRDPSQLHRGRPFQHLLQWADGSGLSDTSQGRHGRSVLCRRQSSTT